MDKEREKIQELIREYDDESKNGISMGQALQKAINYGHNEALQAASEAIKKHNRSNTYEDNESAVFKTTLSEVQSLLLSLKKKV